MAYYSYSRIQSFLTCPLQYEHRYVKKTQSPVPEGVELFMGSRFHEAMEELYKTDRPVGEPPPSLEELLKKFHDSWDEALAQNVRKQKTRGFETPMRITREGMTLDDYRQKAAGFLESYYHRYHPFNQDRTEAIELRVVFKLDGTGKYMMQGYIDRLALDADGTLWVHDYKTGAKKISEEEARNEDQLALYMLGLKQHERFKDYERIRLAWHYVAFEDDAVISDRNPEELKRLRDKYVRHIKQIEAARQFNTNTSPLCGWCEFLTLCKDGQDAVALREKRKAAKQSSAFPQIAALPPEEAAAVVVPPVVVQDEDQTFVKPSISETPLSGPVPIAAGVGKGSRRRRMEISPDQMKLFD